MTERTTVALEQVYTRREIIGSRVKYSLQCSLAQDQKLSLYKKTSTSSSSSDDVVVLRTRTHSQLVRSTDGSICSLLVCLHACTSPGRLLSHHPRGTSLPRGDIDRHHQRKPTRILKPQQHSQQSTLPRRCRHPLRDFMFLVFFESSAVHLDDIVASSPSFSALRKGKKIFQQHFCTASRPLRTLSASAQFSLPRNFLPLFSLLLFAVFSCLLLLQILLLSPRVPSLFSSPFPLRKILLWCSNHLITPHTTFKLLFCVVPGVQRFPSFDL